MKLEKLDPYRLFGSVLQRSRLAMKSAYDGAFAAHHRCTELLNTYQQQGFCDIDPLSKMMNAAPRRQLPRKGLEQIYLDAQAEDLQTDYQASAVVLFADDTLQRFASGVLGKALGLNPGYGPSYGRDVKLTTLLRAGTNAIRHVSEWDDSDLPFPYPGTAHLLDPSIPLAPIESLKKRWRQPMETIRVIQKAFGVGIHERLRDVVSMRIVIAVDGKLGTEASDYTRFEAAMIEAANEIAKAQDRRDPNSNAVERLGAVLA